MKHSVLAISYAKRALDPTSRERVRLRAYAAGLEQYHVIVFTRSTENFPAVQHDGNLTLYATNSTKRLGMLARAYSIGKQILNTQPETRFIVSSQDPFETSLIGRMLTYNTKHIHQVQIHGDVFNPMSYRSSLLQRLRVWYGRRVVRRAVVIRVVSERIKHSLLQLGVPEDRIVVLPIQADLSEFIELGRQRNFLTEPHTPLELLYVGRLSPEKNVSLLLRAVARLCERSVSCQLRIVGAGPEKSTLEQLAKKLHITDRVEFVGWTDNIIGEMSRHVVVCLPSNHEGWGMVLQEAAAMCLPVVTTDVGCAGELIINEETGLVVPVGDASAFANALERLQSTEVRKKLAQAALQKVQATSLTSDEYVTAWVASHIPT